MDSNDEEKPYISDEPDNDEESGVVDDNPNRTSMTPKNIRNDGGMEDDKESHQSMEKKEEEPILDLYSLPVVEAIPEITYRDPKIAFATAVEYIKESIRFGKDRNFTAQQQEEEAEETGRGKRPSVMSFRFPKKSIDDKLGLGFQSINGALTFSTIAPTSPLANSSVRVGDQLISLDNYETVSHWSGEEAATHLRGRVGYISMYVTTKNGDSNIAEAYVYKSRAEEKLGLALYNELGRLRVQRVYPNGLLGEMSALQTDEYMESINSIPVQLMDVAAAMKLIDDCVGPVVLRTNKENMTVLSLRDIMISAQLSSRRYSQNFIEADELDVMESGHFVPTSEDNLPHPGFISVTIRKQTMDTEIGISFRRLGGCNLSILQIVKPGLLCDSPLKPGFLLHSINCIPTLHYTPEEAMNLINSLSGEIRLLAEDRLGDVGYAVAMVSKPSPRTDLGMTFDPSGSPLEIMFVDSDGLFESSILNTGDRVIAINNIPCENMLPREAVQITTRNKVHVTILVRLFRTNVIVMSHRKPLPGESVTNFFNNNNPARTEAAAIAAHGGAPPRPQSSRNDDDEAMTCGALAVCALVSVVVIFVVRLGN